jgi:hypothetical protein
MQAIASLPGHQRAIDLRVDEDDSSIPEVTLANGVRAASGTLVCKLAGAPRGPTTKPPAM